MVIHRERGGLMYNDILDAVVGRLRELFGDEYGICTEPAGQGTSGPCFFVVRPAGARSNECKSRIRPAVGRI